MNQYDPRFDLKINVGHWYLYVRAQWLCLVFWIPFDVWTSFLGIMWICMTRRSPKNKCRSMWPIFHVHWFCVICWRLFDLWTSYFGIMGQYHQTFDLKINVRQCDLYFMVQWFCLMFQRLFDGWVSYFQIMRQGGSNFYLKINIGQHHLFSWSSEFAQYLQDYLMDEHYSWYSGSFEGLKSVPEYLIVGCLV